MLFGANTPATAMFTVTGALPGSTQTACIRITYTGTLTTGVRLFVASGDLTGSGLDSYLTLEVNEGAGNATGGSCSDFTATANLYNPSGKTDPTKTLAAFAATSSSYASGVSNWTATTGSTRTFQLTWWLQAYNAGAGKSATATFTWEARS